MKKKEKKKTEQIVYDKTNKILSIILIVFIIFYIVNNLIMYFNNDYALYFIENIINPLNGLFYFLFSHINYFSIFTYVCYFLFLIIFIISDIYYEIFSKSDLLYRTKIVNNLYRIFVIFSIFFLLPSYLNQLSNHLPNFDQLYFSSTKNKTYTKEDLVNLNLSLEEKIKEISAQVKRDKNGVIVENIDYNKQAVANLKNIADEIPLLKGMYPANSSHINDLMRGVLGSKTVGFTMPYNTYFDYDSSSISVLNTITHEFCHTKGIARENETVYCNFLAGVKSDDPFSQYAAYIEAFTWTTEALLEIDYASGDKIEDGVLSMCLTENYDELCDSYTKNNKEYINGSEYLFISSYRLKNYVNFKDELEKSLKILEKNNAEIIVSGEKASISDIMKLIDENSEERVSIGLKLNRKIFNNIKDSISNKKLYLSIYQKNKDDKDSKDKLKNPEEYYLAPFKDRDEHVFLNSSYGSVEYEYSRVARLILEYYDKEKQV